MKKKSTKNKISKQHISHTRTPDDMTNAWWQIELRKQIASEEKFTVKKIGEGLVFTYYNVHSIASGNNYKVALRSADNSLNFCTCPDFKTNRLGTCKHIEAVLLRINAKSSLRRAMKKVVTLPYSSIYLDYRGKERLSLELATNKRTLIQNLLRVILIKTLY